MIHGLVARLVGSALARMVVGGPFDVSLSGGAAQYVPRDIGAQFLAQHRIAFFARCTLNSRTVLRRKLAVGVEPRPHVAAVRVAQQLSHCGLATENRCRAVQGHFFRLK